MKILNRKIEPTPYIAGEDPERIAAKHKDQILKALRSIEQYYSTTCLLVTFADDSELDETTLHQISEDHVEFVTVDGIRAFTFAEIKSVERAGYDFPEYSEEDLEVLRSICMLQEFRNQVEEVEDCSWMKPIVVRGPVTLNFARYDRYKQPTWSGLNVPGLDDDVKRLVGPWHEYIKRNMQTWLDELETWQTEHLAEQQRLREEAQQAKKLEEERLAEEARQQLIKDKQAAIQERIDFKNKLKNASEAFILAETELAQAFEQ